MADAFDIIDQMLSNEGKKPAKKKRGRPKGSSSKKKKVKESAAPKQEKVEIKYVTEEEWEELGRPATYKGYTTDRLKQWKYKTKAYFEVMLELHRAAVQYSKLTKTIGWYDETDEAKLNLCRKEIEAWRKAAGISFHEMSHVVDICYHAEHKRKKLLSGLRNVALIVLDNRKQDADENDKTLTLNGVAQAPPNIRPNLKFVKLEQYSGDDEILGALADATGNAKLLSEHACSEHPQYRGLRKPRNGCPNCMEFYLYNKKRGVKEKRVRS